MSFDVETALVRELHEVADGVEVPALPPLPNEPHARPVWQPLLVAAAVVLIIVGAVAAVVTLNGDEEIQPSPSPSPTPTVATDSPTQAAEPAPLTTEPPSIPYVVNSRLFVGGKQVPGTDWAFVRGTDTQWVAGSFVNGEYTYWWGNGTEPHLIEGYFQQGLDAAPRGGYWAGIRTQGGQGLLTGADTQSGGEGFGETPIDQSGSGSPPWVAAVTDDGLVITGNGPTILWRPLVDGETIDLADTAPDQVVVDNTQAGLVVVDANSADIDGARNGDVYLADISAEGEISRLGSVPNNDDLAASNAWVSWVEAGATRWRAQRDRRPRGPAARRQRPGHADSAEGLDVPHQCRHLGGRRPPRRRRRQGRQRGRADGALQSRPRRSACCSTPPDQPPRLRRPGGRSG